MSAESTRKNIFGISSSLIVFTCASLLAAITLPLGMRPIADSAAYLSAAEGIVGIGPMLSYDGSVFIHWTPMAAFLLAPVFLFSLDHYLWSSVVNGLLLGLVALLSYHVLLELRISKTWAAFASVGLMLLRPVQIMGSAALSSDIFFLMLLATIFLSYLRWRRRESRSDFIFLIFVSSLSVMARYSGMFIVYAISSALLLKGTGSAIRRFATATTYFFGSLAFFFIYAARNYVMTGHLTDRTLAINRISIDVIGEIFRAMSGSYLSFWGERFVIVRLFFLCAIGLILFLWMLSRGHENKKQRAARPPLHIFWIVAVFYTSCLILTNFFIDSQTSLDIRILSPATYTMYILLTVAIYQIWHSLIPVQFERIFKVTLCTLIFFYATGSAIEVDNQRRSMIVASRAEEFIRSSEQIYASKVLYSNTPDFVFVASRKRARFFPRHLDYMHQQQNPDFEKQISGFISDMRQGATAIILRGGRYPDLVLNEILAIPGMRIVGEFHPLFIVQYDEYAI